MPSEAQLFRELRAALVTARTQMDKAAAERLDTAVQAVVERFDAHRSSSRTTRERLTRANAAIANLEAQLRTAKRKLRDAEATPTQPLLPKKPVPFVDFEPDE